VLIKPASGTFVIELARSTIKYAIIEGFILDATNVMADVVKWRNSSTSGIASFVRLQNNEIRNASSGNGILLNEQTTNNEIIGNWIHHNGGPSTAQQHGIYNNSAKLLVKGNIIENNYCRNISFHNARGYITTSSGVIRDNIVRRDGTITIDGQTCGAKAGIDVAEGNDVLIYNNIVTGNSGIGIQCFDEAQRLRIYHNTIYDNGRAAVDVKDGCSSTEVKNNIFRSNGNDGVANNGTNTIASNNLTSDPLFTDPTKGNFRLKLGSPAIDKGATISAVTTDFEGIPRPQGSGYDIGAFEYKGTTVAPPTAPSNLQVTAY
jgi:hypothetical protein